MWWATKDHQGSGRRVICNPYKSCNHVSRTTTLYSLYRTSRVIPSHQRFHGSAQTPVERLLFLGKRLLAQTHLGGRDQVIPLNGGFFSSLSLRAETSPSPIAQGPRAVFAGLPRGARRPPGARIRAGGAGRALAGVKDLADSAVAENTCLKV